MKRSDGSFVDDQPVGIWRVWDESGKLVSEKDVEAQPESDEAIASPGQGEQGAGEAVIDTDAWKFGETEDLTSGPAGANSVIEPPADDLKLPAIGAGDGAADEPEGFMIDLETVEGEPVPRDPGSLFGG